MATQSILILGAGPAGMAAALALAMQASSEGSNSLKITLLELRPVLGTIGGAINLTPLAMKYLDYLGAGKRVKEKCIDLAHGLDYISLRTGKVIGNIWGDIGAVRVARHALVESLLQTIQEEHSKNIDIQWGKKVVGIEERENKMALTFEDGTYIEGDTLIGADGVHSVVRRLWVEPDRNPQFAGRVVIMGFSDIHKVNDDSSPLLLPDGSPALVDTSILSSNRGMFLASYWEPTRTNVFFALIDSMELPENGDSREGWKALAEDQASLKKKVSAAYEVSPVKGIPELADACKKWQFWPINILPPGGLWHKGKVLLIGDAAHAVSIALLYLFNLISCIDAATGGKYWLCH